MRFENYGIAKTVVVREISHSLNLASEPETAVYLLPRNMLESPTKNSDGLWGDAWSHESGNFTSSPIVPERYIISSHIGAFNRVFVFDPSEFLASLTSHLSRDLSAPTRAPYYGLCMGVRTCYRLSLPPPTGRTFAWQNGTQIPFRQSLSSN